VATIAEAAVSGEFDKTPRRISHLLTMYGFLLNMITTVLMVFVYPSAAATPPLVSTLWVLGAAMVLVGGLWFFFFLRANVAHDGDPPWHLGRADLFIGSLIGGMASSLLWHFAQSIRSSTTTRGTCLRDRSDRRGSNSRASASPRGRAYAGRPTPRSRRDHGRVADVEAASAPLHLKQALVRTNLPVASRYAMR
jgi:hypothetical protein